MLLAESVVEGFRTCSIKNCHVIPTKTPNPYRFAVLKQDFQIMTSRALLHKNPRCKHQTSKLECVEYDRIKNFLKLCMIHRKIGHEGGCMNMIMTRAFQQTDF